MTKEDLINHLRNINFNEMNATISVEPETATYELINGEGIEITQYITTITIKHEEFKRKYKRVGTIKVYEDTPETNENYKCIKKELLDTLREKN